MSRSQIKVKKVIFWRVQGHWVRLWAISTNIIRCVRACACTCMIWSWSRVAAVTASVVTVTLRQDHAWFTKSHCYSGKRFLFNFYAYIHTTFFKWRQNASHFTIKYMLKCCIAKIKTTNDNEYNAQFACQRTDTQYWYSNSVHLSVRLSVRHVRAVFYGNGLT